MTCVAISPTEVAVIFSEKMVRICELMHAILFLQLSCPDHTITAHFLQSFAVFSLCQKELADMSAKSWMMSCQNVVWQVGMKFFPNVGPTFLTFAYMTTFIRTTCHLGGLGDVTQCRHFQLSL